MANVVLALIKAKPLQQRADGCPERLERAGLGAAQQGLELGKDLFDWIEVRTVRGQVPQRSTRALNGRLDAGDLVRAQVIHHHDVAGHQLTNQALLNPGYKCRTIDRSVKHQRRQQSTGASRAQTNVVVCQWPNGACPRQRSPLGERPQMGVMQVVAQVSSRKISRPCPLTGWGRSASQSARAWATSLRACSSSKEGLFFRVKPSRVKVLPMVVGPTNRPCSDWTHWHN